MESESDVSDFDEDVIQHYSPLSEYIENEELNEDYLLNECGDLHSNDSLDTNQKPFNKTYKLANLFSITSNLIKVYLSYINSVFVPSLVPLEYSGLKQLLKSKKFTNCLVQEDLTILLNYESDDEFSTEPKLSYATVLQQCFQLFAFVIILMILESASVMSSVLNQDFQQILPERLIFLYFPLEIFVWCLSKILYLHILVIGLLIITSFLHMFICKLVYHSLLSTVQKIEHLVLIFKKCLRLIQESELIARGFTSASIPGIVERLEVSTRLPLYSPQRQHLELRKYIFKWSRDVFLFYRHATQDLIINLQSQPVIDFAAHALAALDLSEFGDLLGYNVESEVELQELLKLSDNFSISSLKTVYLLAELQISEFYKFLYLGTSFLISEDDLYNCLNRVFDLKAIFDLLRCLQSNQVGVYKHACKLYKYYKSIDMSSDISKNLLEDSSEKTKMSSFAINVHNMSLHLKSTLKRLNELEEVLEKNEDYNLLKNENMLKRTEKMFNEVKLEIDAYNEYYQKCEMELQGVLYKKETPLLVEKIEESINVKSVAMPRCDEVPYIEDEIFEAVVDNFLHENEKDETNYFSSDQRMNVEMSNKLLRELKNVLIVKADEHCSREQKALAKKLNLEEHSDCISMQDTVRESFIETNTVQNIVEFENIDSSDIYLNRDRSETKFINYEQFKEQQDASTTSEFVPNSSNSFAASIAALATQRQKMLGISSDISFSDGTSDDEVDENC